MNSVLKNGQNHAETDTRRWKWGRGASEQTSEQLEQNAGKTAQEAPAVWGC